MLIEVREGPGGGAGLGAALCQWSHVAPQALVRSSPETLSDRALFLARPSGFEGQRAIPEVYWTPSWNAMLRTFLAWKQTPQELQ